MYQANSFVTFCDMTAGFGKKGSLTHRHTDPHIEGQTDLKSDIAFQIINELGMKLKFNSKEKSEPLKLQCKDKSKRAQE